MLQLALSKKMLMKECGFQLDPRYTYLQYLRGSQLISARNQQSTAPAENHYLPYQLVENLDSFVEKVQLSCGSSGESVGKSWYKNKNYEEIKGVRGQGSRRSP